MLSVVEGMSSAAPAHGLQPSSRRGLVSHHQGRWLNDVVECLFPFASGEFRRSSTSVKLVVVAVGSLPVQAPNAVSAGVYPGIIAEGKQGCTCQSETIRPNNKEVDDDDPPADSGETEQCMNVKRLLDL